MTPGRADEMGQMGTRERMTRKRMIKKIWYARWIHLLWARDQERRRRTGKKPVRLVGSARHHRRWVKIYDEVIQALRCRK